MISKIFARGKKPFLKAFYRDINDVREIARISRLFSTAFRDFSVSGILTGRAFALM